MRRAVARLADALAAASGLAASAGFAVMSLVVGYAVIARYVFGSAPSWGEELPRLLLIWSGLLGAVVAGRNDSHLTAGLFPILVRSPRLRAIVARVVAVGSVAIYATLAFAFLQFTARTINNKLPALQVSLAWLYTAGIVGFALLAFMVAANLVDGRERR